MTGGFSPEFIIGLLLILAGAVAVAFPGKKDYLTRLINLEIPGFGLLLVMLSYNEALALFTFSAISVLSTFIYVRVLQKKNGGQAA
jgi:energy-converting hydrogenase A subunit E